MMSSGSPAAQQQHQFRQSQSSAFSAPSCLSKPEQQQQQKTLVKVNSRRLTAAGAGLQGLSARRSLTYDSAEQQQHESPILHFLAASANASSSSPFAFVGLLPPSTSGPNTPTDDGSLGSWATASPPPPNRSYAESHVRRRLSLDFGVFEEALQQQQQTPAGLAKQRLSLRDGGRVGRSSPNPSLLTNKQDSSLLSLTKRFLQLNALYPNGIVNLNEAASYLDVPKRRLYDITNVLEGIDMIEKIGKNSIRWKNTDGSGGGRYVTMLGLREECHQLKKREAELDATVMEMTEALTAATEEPTDQPYAYVSYDDLRASQTLASQTILAVKAPPDSTVKVPNPDETGLQLSIQSSSERAVEVFLCPEKVEEDENSDPSLTPTKSAAQTTVVAPLIKQEDVFVSSPPQTLLLNSTNPLGRAEQAPPASDLDGLESTFPSPSKGIMLPSLLRTPTKGCSALLSHGDHHQPDVQDYLLALERHEGLADLFA